ncbi:MAG: hypothetical protein J7K22_03760 [Nanoarchaeota archaeon]|nr:hypothetical protein [Nanoarchaeota archaeon]
MGIADIFAAILLITGLKPSFLLAFTASVLGVKGILSFLGRFNLPLYFLGLIDILAVLILLFNINLGIFGIFILLVILFKAFISFWSLKALREFVLTISYIAYKIISFGTKPISKSKWKVYITNLLWFGSGKISQEKMYPDKVFSYPYLEKLKERS